MSQLHASGEEAPASRPPRAPAPWCPVLPGSGPPVRAQVPLSRARRAARAQAGSQQRPRNASVFGSAIRSWIELNLLAHVLVRGCILPLFWWTSTVFMRHTSHSVCALRVVVSCRARARGAELAPTGGGGARVVSECR